MSLKLVKNEDDYGPIEIKDFIMDEYETSDLILIDHSKNHIVATFECDDELTTITIRIVGTKEERGKAGVHIFPDDWEECEYRLRSAFEDCFRDGFTTIYIHR